MKILKIKGFARKVSRVLLARYYISRGNYFSKRKKLSQAVACFQRALTLMPNLDLNLLFRELGHSLKPFAERTCLPDQINNKFDAATDYFNNGNYEMAITICQEVCKLFPQFVSAHILLGDALNRTGNFKKSQDHYTVAIALSYYIQERESLQSIVKEVQKNNTIVITHVAINYFPMFEVWFSYFKGHKIENFLVIALDSVVYAKLRSLGINSYLFPFFCYQQGLIKPLYYEIIKLRKIINNMGISYLHSDIDAFWFDNPVDLIESSTGDMVGSVAYGTPEDLVRRWGFVFCCGFYYMRSNEKTKQIFDQYVAYTYRDIHDQNGLNRYFEDQNILWERKPDGSIRGRFDTNDIEVCIMSEQVVTRNPESLHLTPLPSIFHPHLGGGAMNEKIETLHNWGVKVNRG